MLITNDSIEFCIFATVSYALYLLVCYQGDCKVVGEREWFCAFIFTCRSHMAVSVKLCILQFCLERPHRN